MKKSQPIIFVGMMGCGKSSIGKVVSKKLLLNFFDLDNEIENLFRLSVNKIFNSFGEQAFRQKEYEILKNLILKKDVLISTGGGAFCQKKTSSLIRKKCLSVWLDVDNQIIFKRVKNNSKRPLLSGLNDKELKIRIEALSSERSQYYKSADIRIVLPDQPILNSIDLCLRKIKEYDIKYKDTLINNA